MHGEAAAADARAGSFSAKEFARPSSRTDVVDLFEGRGPGDVVEE
jgi:hypothetical protein